ncbi:ABC transporter ATP-binding protein [Treponema denticola]|uniref:ABC transporter ATP-binding protein n=1 Tax=Treponema denticola TaxID=158 RepID=UPI0020A37EC6|nr:ABC transporter ATP-binding protein [Treponema denticola]UTC83637.1 ABC transporter ATP-binding protein [Treponema denticola]
MKHVSYFSHFKKLYGYVSSAGKILPITIILLRIALGLIPFAYISVYSKFIDGIAGKNTNLISIIPVFIVVALLSYFSQNFLNNFISRLLLNLQIKLRSVNIEKISRLKYEHIENSATNDLIKEVKAGVPSILVSGFSSYLVFLKLLLKILSVAAYLMMFSPMMALVMFILLIPVVMVSLKTGKDDYEAFAQFQKISRRMDDYEKILTDKEYAEERTLFNYIRYFEQRWITSYNEATDIFLSVKRKSYAGIKLTSGLITVSFLGMMFFMLLNVIKGTLSIGSFSAVSNELLIMSSAISWNLTQSIHEIAKTNVFLKTIFDFENLSEEIQETDFELKNSEKKIYTDFPENIDIEFKNVSFTYPETEKEILKNVSFKLEQGKSYALVGENGAGKTTITKLLLGLYKNYSGEILINGVNIKDIQDFNKLFSVAFQDFAKYEITLRENIIFDKASVSDEEILKQMHELFFDIAKFEKGLDTDLGYLSENNINMSIGEWQKIALLRSFFAMGNYYILDEPTASLDPDAESKVYNNFLKFISGKSSIIITHRLGAAKLADEILVLSDGTIVEKGSHDELERADGLYKEMYEAQKGWYV